MQASGKWLLYMHIANFILNVQFLQCFGLIYFSVAYLVVHHLESVIRGLRKKEQGGREKR